jgi:penicillin G amidase
MFKKILLGIVTLLIIVLIGTGLFVRSIATRGVPDYNTSLALKNLKQEVVVRRDKFAVPHIIAKNQQDLYRAVGYVMAQDRLWQMDLLKRVTLGRLSEIFGKDLVNVDILMRSLRIPDKSRMILSNSDPKLILALECFSDGVNQFIDTHMDKLPPEFTILGVKPEHWKPEYSFNLIGYMAWDLTMPYSVETILHKIQKKVSAAQFKELLPDVPGRDTSIYQEFKHKVSELDLKNSLFAQTDILEKYGVTIFQGSNNWAVSGKKSVTGRPIMANDMHLGLNAPGLWYQMHQLIEGELNVTGVVLPGQPFVVAGHNDKIAWGMTNVMVDDMDFYAEKINPDNPDQYEFMGVFKDFITRSETIKIKGGEEITKQIKFTHRGPVISKLKKIKDETITMKWVGNEASNEMRSIYLLNYAQNWKEFKNALTTFTSASQNIVYSDIKGNIGLYCCAGVPIRKKGDGLAIVPGWTDEYDWQGIVPFEELPHSYNPESGYVSSANNKTAPNDYPYHISNWFALDYRIDRIREMLEEKEKLSVKDFQRMHGDFKSKLVEEFNPLIIKELDKINDMTALEQQAFDDLKQWDGVLNKESSAAATFEMFFLHFVENLIKDEMGESIYQEYFKSSYLARYLVNNVALSGNSQWADNILTKDKKETLTDIVYLSFKNAVAQLSDKMGTSFDKWAWGNIHKLELNHPLGSVKILDKIFGFNAEPVDVGGSFHTVCPYRHKFTKPFAAIHGASQRHIYLPDSWDESLSIIPTGTCGVPASKHYCDQTKMYANNQYHQDIFTMEETKKISDYKLTFKPKN